jgi:DNA-binding response OmpR family regulator
MSLPLKMLLVEDDWSVRSAVRDYLARHDMHVLEADCLETALEVASTGVIRK